MTTRRTPRPPLRPQSATTTSKAKAAAKSPSVVRDRACVPIKRPGSVRLSSTVISELGAMGIDAETARRVLEIIKADAASRSSGKVRTRDVIAAVEALGLKARVTPAAVIILAGTLGLQTERGPAKGEGKPSGTGGRMGGRPAGIHTRYSRLRDEVRRLAKEGHRAAEIARKLGTTRQNVHKLLTDGND